MSQPEKDYERGYSSPSQVSQTTSSSSESQSEEQADELASRSQRTSDFVWRLVITVLSAIMAASAIIVLQIVLLNPTANPAIPLALFSSTGAVLLALLVPSPLDVVSRALNSVIRYWAERQRVETRRIAEAEARAKEAEERRRIAEQALLEERLKGIRLAENIKGRVHEAAASGKDTIETNELVRMIEDIIPETRPPKVP